MVRKRTADERRRCAEENGFNDDDMDIDDEPVLREYFAKFIAKSAKGVLDPEGKPTVQN
ncbi:hypothetical protein B0T26DRAFT_716694, partial [Lasiosphaeria miniovina]